MARQAQDERKERVEAKCGFQPPIRFVHAGQSYAGMTIKKQ
jgi:hypothetical protein